MSANRYFLNNTLERYRAGKAPEYARSTADEGGFSHTTAQSRHSSRLDEFDEAIQVAKELKDSKMYTGECCFIQP